MVSPQPRMPHEVTPEFRKLVKAASDVELVVLQHEMRRYPDDRLFLECVLDELADRQKQPKGQ